MKPATVDAATFVLAGGRSSRMGRDKALLAWGETTLLDHVLGKLRVLHGAPPRIVASREDLSQHAEVIADRHIDCGPLGGIEAALAVTRHPWNLFVAVDLPLIPTAFLAWMLNRAQTTGALMTLPRINGRPQSLCAVYHRDLLPAVTRGLVARNRKVMPVMMDAAGDAAARDLFDVESVSAALPEITTYAPLPLYRWFHNCNTPEDMAAVGNALLLTP